MGACRDYSETILSTFLNNSRHLVMSNSEVVCTSRVSSTVTNSQHQRYYFHPYQFLGDSLVAGFPLRLQPYMDESQIIPFQVYRAASVDIADGYRYNEPSDTQSADAPIFNNVTAVERLFYPPLVFDESQLARHQGEVCLIPLTVSQLLPVSHPQQPYSIPRDNVGVPPSSEAYNALYVDEPREPVVRLLDTCSSRVQSGHSSPLSTTYPAEDRRKQSFPAVSRNPVSEDQESTGRKTGILQALLDSYTPRSPSPTWSSNTEPGSEETPEEEEESRSDCGKNPAIRDRIATPYPYDSDDDVTLVGRHNSPVTCSPQWSPTYAKWDSPESIDWTENPSNNEEIEVARILSELGPEIESCINNQDVPCSPTLSDCERLDLSPLLDIDERIQRQTSTGSGSVV